MREWMAMVGGACALGLGANLLMDAWSALLRRWGVPTLDYALLGRWAGHWPRGQWFHPSIRHASPVRGERLGGWALHYITGVVFALVFVAVVGTGWLAAPTWWPALAFGVVTVLLPWLVVQPAFGAGLASAKTPQPWRRRAVGLAMHVVFGTGLYVTALVLSACRVHLQYP